MPRPATLLILASLSLTALAAAEPPAPSPSQAPTMHHEMSPRAPEDRLQVAVLLSAHAILLDWAIPAEILRAAGHGQAFHVFTVSEDGEPVSAMLPPTVGVDFALGDAPRPDVVVVPGGNWQALAERPRVLDFLRRARREGAIVMSVCSGAYTLAAAGLLDGREATRVHSQLDLLRRLAPRATVRGDVPFVESDGVVTTAGAATAIGATLWLVEELVGEAEADFLASAYLDYEPPGRE